MSLPPLLREEIERNGELPEPFVSARFATVDDHPCEGARFHSPIPLVTRPVPTPSGVAWLCSTCADNLALLKWVNQTYDDKPPWPLRREFGNGIRRLVTKVQEATDAG